MEQTLEQTMELENLPKREANKITTRYEILRASRQLFTKKGFDETMMVDIAERAGVSKATVYNYFPNKESLLEGTIDDTTQMLRDELNSDEHKDMDAEEKLRLAIECLVSYQMKYPSVARRITYLNSDKNSTLYNRGNGMIQIFYDLVKECQDTGIYKKDENIERIVDGVLGLYFTAQFRWFDLEEADFEWIKKRVDLYFDELMLAFKV